MLPGYADSDSTTAYDTMDDTNSRSTDQQNTEHQDSNDNWWYMQSLLQVGDVFERWAAHALRQFGDTVELTGRDYDLQRKYGDSKQGHEMKCDSGFHYSRRFAVELFEKPQNQYDWLESGVQRPYVNWLVQGNLMSRDFVLFDADPLREQTLEWWNTKSIYLDRQRKWSNSYTATTKGVYIYLDELQDFQHERIRMEKEGEDWLLVRSDDTGFEKRVEYEPHPDEAFFCGWGLVRHKQKVDDKGKNDLQVPVMREHACRFNLEGRTDEAYRKASDLLKNV